ncbi:signal peptidase complex catalytic subunit SEC11 [Acrasis kona]|uniref:Signal peptidase complex catalytic subunit SEC11 n=1 Tax=Acrasis kona TaxID=1008807 RepID=A0AAW2YN59_9EUKA
MDTFNAIRGMNKREFASQTVSLLYVVASALVIWKMLSVVTDCESPIVVVLTGSMEPAFWRGDILFLYMGKEPFQVGDIVVYKQPGKEIPIVHRLTTLHVDNKGRVKMLTKGDNNHSNDRYGIYNQDIWWLEREHIIGRVKGYLPYVGMVTIIMNDYPMVKFAVIGILAIMTLTSKEQ